MTLLDELRAYLRARLIPDVRAAWRLWSVHLAAIGAGFYAWLIADPAGVQAAWASLPAEVRELLPDQLQRWITAALFVLVLVARVIRQQGSGK